MSVFWGCFRINVFGLFNEEHGGHLHEYHVPRTTALCGGYTYMVYTDYTDYTDYVGLHAYGLPV